MTTTAPPEPPRSTAPEPLDLGGTPPRRRRLLLIGAAAIVIAVAAFLLLRGGDDDAAVGSSHFGTTLGVAYEADSDSELAFLQYLDKEIAPKYGVRIKPAGIGDGNQLDQATADGQYAANIYQHKHWLKQVTDKTGWKLTATGPVFQWAYSLYSEKYKSLDDLPKGARIALLNDPANTAQALWLLERAGKLTFKPGTDGWAATTKDIASNPQAYKFTFVDYGAGPRVLPEVDAVIAYNMQFNSAGIDPSKRIYAPPAPLEFAGQLVVGTDYLNDPQVKKLIQVFNDPAVQPYLKSTSDPRLKDQLSPVSES